MDGEEKNVLWLGLISFWDAHSAFMAFSYGAVLSLAAAGLLLFLKTAPRDKVLL